VERKTLQAQIVGSTETKAEGADVGIIEAVVNAYNIVDSMDERTLPGCVAESIAKKLPRGVWSHRWDQPIAKTLEARDLAPGDALLPESLRALGGMYVKAQFHREIDDSWQAYLKLKNGYIDEFSIGYDWDQTTMHEDTGVRDLVKLTWHEWSPVLVGSNQATGIVSLKSLGEGHVGLRLVEHSEAVHDAALGLANRLERLATKRGQTDRPELDAKYGDALGEVIERLSAVKALCATPDVAKLPAGLLTFEAICRQARQRNAS